MSIDPDLLAILVCPQAKTSLSAADGAVLMGLNARILGGGVMNAAGRPVEKPLAAGLVRADGRVLYPIIDDIPVLLIDEGIPL